jgi:hypothetical protein
VRDHGKQLIDYELITCAVVVEAGRKKNRKTRGKKVAFNFGKDPQNSMA